MEMIQRIAVTAALALAPAAFAQTYIVPDADCGAITFHATRGTDFPNLGEAIGADQVNDAYVFLPKQRVAVKPAAAARSLDFNTTVTADDEVVMASVDFRPVISGNETRTEHAKALIFCGANTPIADWQRSTGLGVEIYPQEWNGTRPRLKSGDSMWFIAVDKTTKKLLRDLPMELYRAGGGRIAAGVPNKIGGMTFPYPDPGRYMVTTTYRRPDPQQPDHWLVDTSTLTFDVK
jgi:hypothetical protein